MIPLVSICLPTFNGEKFIVETMDSILQQDYPNLEIIVSDDRSKDETIPVIESYKVKTDIPIYIHQHTPRGIGANWNNCVRKSNGDFIKFLFQDDILEPDCISKMVHKMEISDNIGLVYAKRKFIYDTSFDNMAPFIETYGHLHTYWRDFAVDENVISGKKYLKDSQFLNSPKNKIGEPPSTLLRKSAMDKIGGFSEELLQTLDSDYWYRLMKYFDVIFIDDYLSKFRIHSAQASNVNKSKNIPDKDLMNYRYYKYLFWSLSLKNKWKLLKLYHPIIKFLIKLKAKLYAS